ncbi:MAG TPA: LiaF domain-containing protein [Herpetosiphonaceae bacterium]|nr:LiaF domain-containing protein [Herpetosiphonaceae bacterium]
MDIYAFTNGRPYFAPGWHDEDVITLFGNVTIDVRNTPPRDDAVMTVLVMFGNATVIVPAGTHVSVGGFSLFSGRTVDLHAPPSGPRLRLTLSSVFGQIKVVEALPEASPPAELGQQPAAVPAPDRAMTGQTVPLNERV